MYELLSQAHHRIDLLKKITVTFVILKTRKDASSRTNVDFLNFSHPKKYYFQTVESTEAHKSK